MPEITQVSGTLEVKVVEMLSTQCHTHHPCTITSVTTICLAGPHPPSMQPHCQLHLLPLHGSLSTTICLAGPHLPPMNPHCQPHSPSVYLQCWTTPTTRGLIAFCCLHTSYALSLPCRSISPRQEFMSTVYCDATMSIHVNHTPHSTHHVLFILTLIII